MLAFDMKLKHFQLKSLYYFCFDHCLLSGKKKPQYVQLQAWYDCKFQVIKDSRFLHFTTRLSEVCLHLRSQGQEKVTMPAIFLADCLWTWMRFWIDVCCQTWWLIICFTSSLCSKRDNRPFISWVITKHFLAHFCKLGLMIGVTCFVPFIFIFYLTII